MSSLDEWSDRRLTSTCTEHDPTQKCIPVSRKFETTKNFREKQVVFASKSETAVIGKLIQLFIFEKITLTVVEINDTEKIENFSIQGLFQLLRLLKYEYKALVE
jgi:hypothetical protein